MAEIAAHHGVHHAGLGLLHATPLHAVVLRLDDDAETLGLTELLDFVGKDHHSLFLDVRAGEDPVSHAGEFGETDHPGTRFDPDPAVAHDRHQVV